MGWKARANYSLPVSQGEKTADNFIFFRKKLPKFFRKSFEKFKLESCLQRSLVAKVRERLTAQYNMSDADYDVLEV